ncbi:DNA-3-methyladenine glycosylase [Gracilimonas sediminicola]|uniref:Putative 3-methyladenine DNA glycosylase n=1 Tax=Gracilimonas sediminicola TaxID=2952158 RepID=A0A9X2L4V9_9BACT|nr:DNA-3-methyladenine glycosylase [Gracilimonas sediminicola]MCP9292410.1 DNA-3-methyladenine glycosylase [Gracilimonas sediminicola]
MSSKLSRSFYERDEVVQISKELIGKVICTNFDGLQTAGIIVETEAYNGRTDRACHAYPDVRTARTETIYGPPGYAYVYLCYGIHHLFNVVTNKEGLADAILIRAIQPIEGEDVMVQRRGKDKLQPVITNGPGKLSQAMGITTSNNECDLLGDIIWVEDREIKFEEEEIEASPRIGVDYAGEDAGLPWRFTVKGSKWISK